jgi:peptidoglycan/xylan/chitin deacetylase (PgdA/CDA1 family)
MILLYHNVIDDSYPTERWYFGMGLPVSCFKQHLFWLIRHRRVVSLSAYLDLTANGTLPAGNVVALTFDDGLATTFQRVFPLLRQWAVPATFFISTSHLENGKMLWFSYLNALCFEGAYEEIKAGGSRFKLTSLEQRTSARHALGAIARMSGNPMSFTDELADDYPLPTSIIHEYAGMSHEQLSFFSRCVYLEAGAHTVFHPYLDQLSIDEQAEEIFRSKRQLSELIGKPVRYFAYPSGDYNENTLKLVRAAGFDAAFTTNPRHLGPRSRFEIERTGIYSKAFSRFWLKAHGAVTVARLVRRNAATAARLVGRKMSLTAETKAG